MPRFFIVIALAWFFEFVGVFLGIINSITITFPKDLPTDLLQWAPALPVLALACAELFRIPAVMLFHSTSKVIPKTIAILAVVGLVAVAGENWFFGLERTVNQRLVMVAPLRDAVHHIDNAIKAQMDADSAAQKASAENRKTLLATIEKGQNDLARIDERARIEADTHLAKQKSIAETCMKVAYVCYGPKEKEEAKRYREVQQQAAAERSPIYASLERARAELQRLTSADGGVSSVPLAQLHRDLEQARIKLAREAEQNPIYRMTASWFGKSVIEVTDDELAAARQLFSMFGAAIISFVGTAVALVYYWPKGQATGVARLLWMLRAYIARLRKKVVRTVHVDREVVQVIEKKIAEKEVPVIITKIIFTPYSGAGPLPAPVETIERLNDEAGATFLKKLRHGVDKATRLEAVK